MFIYSKKLQHSYGRIETIEDDFGENEKPIHSVKVKQPNDFGI